MKRREVVMDLPNVWTKYSCKLKLRDKLLGGVPRTDKQIEGWLNAKALKGKEAEIRADIDPVAEEEKHWCGFRQNGDGLYIRGAMIKQGIKNWASDLKLWQQKGKRGVMGLLHRTMFVKPTEIMLGKKKPDGVHEHQGTVSGPGGKRSILSKFDYVTGVEIDCEIWLIETCPLNEADLLRCFAVGQEAGLGPLRPHDFGKFDLLQLTLLET